MKGWKDNIVKAYYDYMVDIAVLFGADRSRALKELKDAVELEMKLANVIKPNDLFANQTFVLFNRYRFRKRRVEMPLYDTTP